MASPDAPPPEGELLEFVYEQLRAIAEQRMVEERREHTLQATALVHEAYLRVAPRVGSGLENRTRFVRAAAPTMRRGGLLYEILTGSPPLGARRLQEAALDERKRIITEEEPVKPSTRCRRWGRTRGSSSTRSASTPSPTSPRGSATRGRWTSERGGRCS